MGSPSPVNQPKKPQGAGIPDELTAPFRSRGSLWADLQDVKNAFSLIAIIALANSLPGLIQALWQQFGPGGTPLPLGQVVTIILKIYIVTLPFTGAVTLIALAFFRSDRSQRGQGLLWLMVSSVLLAGCAWLGSQVGVGGVTAADVQQITSQHDSRLWALYALVVYAQKYGPRTFALAFLTGIATAWAVGLKLWPYLKGSAGPSTP